MTLKDKIRQIGLTMRAPCVPCVFSPPLWGLLGSQSELTLIQASAFRSTQQLNGCYDKRLQLPVQQLLT